jgi:hypothetical protein
MCLGNNACRDCNIYEDEERYDKNTPAEDKERRVLSSVIIIENYHNERDHLDQMNWNQTLDRINISVGLAIAFVVCGLFGPQIVVHDICCNCYNQ